MPAFNLIALLAIAAAQGQGEWTEVAREHGGTTWSVDSTTIRREGPITVTWAKVVNPRQGGYELWNLKYDCAAWISQAAVVIRYRDDGAVLNTRRTVEVPGSSIGYEPIPPQSVDEIIARRVCGR